jgi:predicted RNA-binding Zn ribbon-like protein
MFMHQNQFELLGGALCLDFLNTIHEYGADDPREELHHWDDFIAFGSQTGAITSKEAQLLSRSAKRNPLMAGKALSMAKECRQTLYRIFAAIANSKSPLEKDLDLLNQQLARILPNLRLRKKRHEMEWTWKQEENLERILWPIIRSAAELLTSKERGLIRECKSQTCTWMFLDRSKNRTRRWCDMKICGNRAKWKRFYNRQNPKKGDPKINKSRSAGISIKL